MRSKRDGRCLIGCLGVLAIFCLMVFVWRSEHHYPEQRAQSETPTDSLTNNDPPAQQPVVSEGELKRLKDSRQYDLNLIVAIQAVLTAASPNDAVTAYCDFTIKQAEALTQTTNDSVDNNGDWYEKQNIGVCRARVLTGVAPMPLPDQLREYLSKAQRDLTDTDKKLADAGISLEPSAEPTSK